MLCITSDSITSKNKRWGSWHVGETLNIPEGPVIIFQADGHELSFILQMFQEKGIEVYYPADRLTPVL